MEGFAGEEVGGGMGRDDDAEGMRNDGEGHREGADHLAVHLYGKRDGGFEADGAAAFTEAVTRLLACRDLRRSLGIAGRSLLEKEFTWDTAWKNLHF